MAFLTASFYAKTLNRPVTINVVMPTDKYDVRTGKPMPNPPKKTLYLLHGLMGNHTDWVNGTRLQALATAYDLAVVMPCGDNKFYCDSSYTGDLYGTFIAEELVRFTRDTFNLSRRREDTFIGGLSMGGFGAIVNGLRHPEVFSRITAFSAALIKDSILHSYDEPGHDFFTKQQYCTMFDLKNIEEYEGSVNDYEALARNLAASGAEKPIIYLSCGRQDGLYASNVGFRDLLLSLGYDVTWVRKPGVHNWAFWDDQIEQAMQWLPLGSAVLGASSENVVKS